MNPSAAPSRLPAPNRAGASTFAAMVCRRAVSAVILVGVLVMASTMPASSQINPFRNGISLTNEDWTQMEAARNKALADPAAVGTKESWTNPKSGNSGRIEITKAFTTDDLPCRSVTYLFYRKGQAEPRTYLMKQCKTADGTWKYY